MSQFSSPIHAATIRDLQYSNQSQLILPNEIPGLVTRAIKLSPNQSLTFSSSNNINSSIISIFLILNGSCKIIFNDDYFSSTSSLSLSSSSSPLSLSSSPSPSSSMTMTSSSSSSTSLSLDELTLIIPSLNQSLTIESIDHSEVIGLELQWLLRDDINDKTELFSSSINFPYIKKYSECSTYNEAIKSHKTISRTLLAPRIIPRLALGSVKTNGPDLVAPHKHPMLEQLFIGLKNNHCKVTCDDFSIILNEFDLLHIPLGSLHGVSVDEAFSMHYIWIDCFNTVDYSWIEKNHEEKK